MLTDSTSHEHTHTPRHVPIKPWSCSTTHNRWNQSDWRVSTNSTGNSCGMHRPTRPVCCLHPSHRVVAHSGAWPRVAGLSTDVLGTLESALERTVADTGATQRAPLHSSLTYLPGPAADARGVGHLPSGCQTSASGFASLPFGPSPSDCSPSGPCAPVRACVCARACVLCISSVVVVRGLKGTHNC